VLGWDSSIARMSKADTKFQLIALDIDGTIRDDTGNVTTFMKDVLNECQNRGAIVVAATGRTRISAMNYLQEVPMIEFLASFQGSLITRCKTDDFLWRTYMCSDQINRALDYLEEQDIEKVAYSGDQVYVEEMTDWAHSYGLRSGVNIIEVDDLRSVQENVFRILAVGEAEEIKRIEKEMKNRFSGSLYATRSLPHFCEILNRDAGKDKALQWICEFYGIDSTAVISFGNGFNDVEMLKWSGLGVAIEEGEAPALEAANDIALPVNKDGVGRYLEQLILDERIGR